MARLTRLKDTNLVPLGVAIQALALFVAALFVAPGASPPDPNGTGGHGADTAESLTSLSELPTDLKRERLSVPRVPERDDANEPRQPAPASDGSSSLPSEGSKLDSLRTQTVALSGPVAIPIAAPMLGVPDSLDGLSLAGGTWHGGGTSSSRTRGTRTGGGPTDVPGAGRGIGGGGGGRRGGGYCPTPGRIGGGGSRGGGGATSGGRGRPRS